MTKPLPFGKIAKTWQADPDFQRDFDALAEEFELAAALIKARTEAGLTQDQLAARMGTTQSVIARMEGGKSRPSTTTLQKLAAATGTRLRVSFERNERPKRSAA
jgi:ribosome-binding protein aMBF1 (putative translation factor)